MAQFPSAIKVKNTPQGAVDPSPGLYAQHGWSKLSLKWTRQTPRQRRP
ncbi:MAG: hypothetical protein RIT46_735 [Pseudomonadota bacterium]